jgi:hypothetical protein
MNELLITLSVLALTLCAGIAYYFGYSLGKRRGRDEQWVENYLANERKTQAGRDKLGRFKKRKAQYGKIKITAPKNEF